MSFGLNPILPSVAALPSSPPGQSTDPADDDPGATDTGGASGAGDTTGTEQSSGGSATGQTTETRPTQNVQPVSTDVAVARAERSDVSRAEPTAEQDAQASRKLAMKARSESIVAALVEAISAPIEAKELATLEEAGEADEAARSVAQTRTDQLEEGLSAIREDS